MMPGNIEVADSAVCAMRKIIELTGIPEWALASPELCVVPEIYLRPWIQAQGSRHVAATWDVLVGDVIAAIGQMRVRNPQAFKILNRKQRRAMKSAKRGGSQAKTAGNPHAHRVGKS